MWDIVREWLGIGGFWGDDEATAIIEEDIVCAGVARRVEHDRAVSVGFDAKPSSPGEWLCTWRDRLDARCAYRTLPPSTQMDRHAFTTDDVARPTQVVVEESIRECDSYDYHNLRDRELAYLPKSHDHHDRIA